MVPRIEVDASDRRLNGSWLFCFPELGPSCLRPTKMEDRMDVGLQQQHEVSRVPQQVYIEIAGAEVSPFTAFSSRNVYNLGALLCHSSSTNSLTSYPDVPEIFFPSVWLQCVRGGLTSWPAVHGGLSRLSVPQPNFNGLSSFNGCCHWRQ